MTIFEKWKRESCAEESKALRLRCQKYWGRGNGRGCPLPQLTRKSGSTSISMSGLRLDAKFILKHSSLGTSVFIHLKGFFSSNFDRGLELFKVLIEQSWEEHQKSVTCLQTGWLQLNPQATFGWHARASNFLQGVQISTLVSFLGWETPRH